MVQGHGNLLWKGGPSQVVNFQAFFLCALIPLLSFPLNRFWHSHEAQLRSLEAARFFILVGLWVLPLIVALAKWITVKCRSYELTAERFSERYGVFNKVTDELELYRIKDTACYEPLLLRTFGVGNVILYTSDRSTPVIVIQAIPNVKKIQALIRDRVEKMRTLKGVREID